MMKDLKIIVYFFISVVSNHIIFGLLVECEVLLLLDWGE
jgi:hypothetical protein